jgi:adenylosuccinate synthase
MPFDPKNKNAGRHLCVVGVQWGDEGKGKIVDALSHDFDAVVRYQGGANAGHTVQIGDEEFVFHLVPSGVLEGKTCILGNGVVVDVKTLIGELDDLKERGLDYEDRIWVSERAHLVMPYHRVFDRLQDVSADGARIGTTLRGIGPCYTDKVARRGIRAADLVRFDRFEALLRENLESVNRTLTELYGEEPLEAEPILEEFRAYADRIGSRICNIADLLREVDARGEGILFEGAQGLLLDIDLGSYPYVTSSNTSFLGLGPGTGFSPRQVGTVTGITKAYATRVGEGPFPTELEDATGEELRRAGHEFGATTGRPRRCGWLDLYALRYAIAVGDIDNLVITKLDVLDDFDKIYVCVGYEGVGDVRSGGSGFPLDLDKDLRPVYVEIPGWNQSTAACRKFQDLPAAAQSYLQFIVDAVQCPASMLSVGKERSQLVCMDPWLGVKGPVPEFPVESKIG